LTDIFRFIRFFVSVASGQAADAVAARNLLSDAISLVPKESVWVGTTDTAMYYPRLAGKRVALLANHTSMIGERHLVDILHARGFDVTAIFAPEHGFRGTADPGEHMGGSVDGYSDPVALRREHAEAFRRGDALVRGGVNRLDAGVLYLNYIERLDACVGFEREAIGPERPNLNGMLIDGPILEERYEAGWNMCAGWLSRDMLRRRSATGGGRISGCPVFKESHLFYTKSDLYSVLFVNKVCEYAGIARKAEEMLFFLSDFSGRFEINFYICNDAL
jgi:hypothetical protein